MCEESNFDNNEERLLCFLCKRALHPALGGGFEDDFERCLDCSIVFRKRAAHLSVQAERAFYQTHQNHVLDTGYRRFLSKVTEPLKTRLAPGAHGLDFGAGPAPALVLLMNEAGFAMSGYDPLFSPDETLLDQTYDFVTCTEVVEHFKAPARDWAGLFSLVRRGGLLAVMTEWYRGQSPLRGWRYARDPTHCAFYSQGALSRIAELYGAKVDFPGDNVSFFSL